MKRCRRCDASAFKLVAGHYFHDDDVIIERFECRECGHTGELSTIGGDTSATGAVTLDGEAA